ncbi:hypothetical protein ACNQR9_19005 [Mycolicibacterium peregrinum]
MTFPNSPFGQGFPDQAGYQPPYTQQPGFPPVLGQQPGYPGQQPQAQTSGQPSGVTGTIAAVLAALGALAGAAVGTGQFFDWMLSTGLHNLSSSTYVVEIVATVITFTSGLVLLVGSILLFQRKLIGRIVVVIGCSLALLSGLGLFVAVDAFQDDYPGAPDASPLSLVSLVFPIATIVLTLVPSTTAWIRAKQNPVAPQPYPQNPATPQTYPQYPGWS